MNNTHNHKNIIVFLLIFQFVVISLSLFFIADRYADSPLTITSVLATNESTNELLEGKTLRYTFTAYDNNLGIVSILINTYNRSNRDEIRFRIGEAGKHEWFYSNKYNTESISASAYYPFGFPLQTESKGKKYIVELASQNGQTGNVIGVSSSKKILIKYVFSRSEITHSFKTFIPHKLLSYALYFDSTVIMITTIPYLIFLWFYFFRRKTLDIITPFFTSSNHITTINAYAGYLRKTRYQWQVALVLLFFILFFDCALIAKRDSINNLPILSFIFFIFLHFMFFFLLSKIMRFRKRIPHLNLLNVGLLLTLMLVIVLRTQFMSNTLDWDSGFYFQDLMKSLEKFNFTFSNFFSTFQWGFQYGGGHPSYGIGLYLGIFNFLQPGNVILLNSAFFILHIFLIVSLYFLFRKVLPSFSSLIVAVLATSPLIFTSSIIFSTDYPSFVFFIIFLAFFVNRVYLLAIFAACLSLFSKETGILIYGVFIVTYSSYEIHKTIFHDRQYKNLYSLLSYLYKYVFLCFPIILFGLYVLLNKGKMWGGGVDSVSSSFAINYSVIYQRLGQMAILNWNWLLCILLVVFFVLSKKKMGAIFSNSIFTALLASGIVYVIFNLTYITVTHPRYVVMTPFYLVFFMAVFIQEQRRDVILNGVLGIVVVFNCIQIFKTIDPISMAYFGTMKFGDHTLLKISDDYSSRCDSLVYNTEYTYINRLLNAFNEEVKISKSDTVIFNVLGKHYENAWLVYYEFMNIDRGYHLTFKTHDTYKPTVLYSNNISNQASRSQGNWYYVFLPWLTDNKDEGMKDIQKQYAVGKELTINLNGYWLRYYKLSRLRYN